MDFIANIIIGIIVFSVLTGVFYKKIVAFFATVIFSKVVSIVLCLLATAAGVFWMYVVIYVGIPEAGTVVDYSTPEGKMNMIAGFCPLVSILLTALGWLLYAGEKIFDVYYDGTFKLYDVGDYYVAEPKQKGGFFGNLGFAMVIAGIFWVIAFSSSDWIFVSIVPPLGVIISDTVKLIKAWRERDDY